MNLRAESAFSFEISFESAECGRFPWQADSEFSVIDLTLLCSSRPLLSQAPPEPDPTPMFIMKFQERHKMKICTKIGHICIVQNELLTINTACKSANNLPSSFPMFINLLLLSSIFCLP
jgi:hypothetical protein